MIVINVASDSLRLVLIYYTNNSIKDWMNKSMQSLFKASDLFKLIHRPTQVSLKFQTILCLYSDSNFNRLYQEEHQVREAVSSQEIPRPHLPTKSSKVSAPVPYRRRRPLGQMVE